MLKIWKAAVVGLVLLWAGVLVLGEPAEPVNIELILDASSSMSESVAGAIKIEAAKQAIIELLDTFPDGCNVGLRAYGHNYADTDKGNSCVDTELLWEIQPLDKDAREAMKAKLAAIEAKGMTPIAYSLEQAIIDFEGKTGTNSIILISDGKETCGGDPESVAAEIHQLTTGLKMYVIGFDVSSDEQLRSIASKTGGEYYSAVDASELAIKLGEAGQEVISRETPFVFSDSFDLGPNEKWDLTSAGCWTVMNRELTALDTAQGQWYKATIDVPSLTHYTMEVDIYLGTSKTWGGYRRCAAMILAKGSTPDEHSFYLCLTSAEDATHKVDYVTWGIDAYQPSRIDLQIDCPVHVKIEVNGRIVTIYLNDEEVGMLYAGQAETMQASLQLNYYADADKRSTFDNFRIEEIP